MAKNKFIDSNHFYGILMRGDRVSQDLLNILQVKELREQRWKSAIEEIYRKDNLNYEYLLIGGPYNGYILLLSKAVKSLKYALNLCNDLKDKYSAVLSLVNDVHLGVYRYIKIEDQKIVRFFERDANSVTGEFGDLTIEERQLLENSSEHDYFHTVRLLENILDLQTLRNDETVLRKNVIVGKRYLEDIEKYKEYLFLLKKNKEPLTQKDNHIDLPF